MGHNLRLLNLMPIESRVLLLTAGDSRNDAALRQQLQQPISWDQLLILAEWERTLPWSWYRIRDAGVPVPPDAAAAFDRLSRVCEFQSLTLEDRLQRLLSEFGKAGIRTILLKGAAIALTAYGSFSERPMGDLDILVAPSDAARAWEIALAQGWSWDMNAYPHKHYEAHHHLPPLYDAARTGVKLELHTALSLSSHPYALSFDEAVTVSRPLPGRGESVLALDAEHTVIHLAVHFAWAHLASFGMWRLGRDLGALSRAGVDWERAVALSAEYKASRSLFWSLRLADTLCGVEAAPAWVLEKVRPARPKWFLEVLERHLAVHVIARVTPCPSEKWRRLMWSLALSPSGTATSRARPWDSEPARRDVVGDVGFADRLRSQVMRGRDWRRYFALLRSAS